MNQKSAKQRVAMMTCIIIISAVLVFSAIYIPISLKLSNAWTSANLPGNAVVVGDLYASSGGGDSALNTTNIIQLNQYLFGKNHQPADLATPLTATDIRNSTNGGKTAGQSVIVTLGGKQWTVTYVSKAKNGDLIATLWLTENATTSTFGNSSSYYGKDAPTSGVPTNMYGTSYIRAESLNNGGKYINITSNTANPTSVGSTASQETNHVFAPFTMSNATTYKGLTTFIVKPSQVSWQENGQSTKALFNWGNNCSNDNWTDTKSGATADDQFYSAGYNYAGKSFSGYGNSTWANDYIWLPSISETGFSGEAAGIWQTNQNERSNSTTSWLRSAYYISFIRYYTLDADGSSYYNSTVYYSYAIRPALHWNLKSAASHAANFSVTVASEDNSRGAVSGTSSYAALSGEKFWANSNILYLGDAQYSASPAAGYYFDGWYKDGVKITNTSGNPGTITAASNIVAKFIANKYTIVYNGNGATSGSTGSSSHEYNVAKNLTANGYARTGYTFLGWSTNNAATTATYTNGQSVTNLSTQNGATVNLYAVWAGNHYGVVLDQQLADNGTPSVTATFGSAMPALAKLPSAAGYTFGGYFDQEGGAGTAYYAAGGGSLKNWDKATDATLYAKWTANITLNLEGGTGGTSIVTVTYKAAMPTATAPKRTGYTFGGYYTESGGSGTRYYADTMASEKNWDLTVPTNLYAKWVANTYTVTFNYNGATGENGVANKQVTYGNFYSDLPLPIKTGSSFAGWYLESNFVNKVTSTSTMLTAANHTLYAKWIAWLNVYVSGTSSTVSAVSELNALNTEARVSIYPAAGQYVQKFSFDNSVYYEIAYAQTVVSELNFAVSGTFEASRSVNACFLAINGLLPNVFETYGPINLYLVMMNTKYDNLKTAGGASVTGVAVSATKGGCVTIIGDDYENLLDTDTVTVRADVCLEGYRFVGWYAASNMSTCLSSLQSEKFAKSLVMETELIAVFEPVAGSSDVNGDTNV